MQNPTHAMIVLATSAEQATEQVLDAVSKDESTVANSDSRRTPSFVPYRGVKVISSRPVAQTGSKPRADAQKAAIAAGRHVPYQVTFEYDLAASVAAMEAK